MQNTNQSIDEDTDAYKNFRSAVDQECNAQINQQNNVDMTGIMVTHEGHLAIHQKNAGQILVNCLGKSDQFSKTVDKIAHSMEVEAKQTVEDSIMGILLAVALIMGLFILGPVIATGSATGLVFDNLLKTPSTRLMLVGVLYFGWILYVINDCHDKHPTWKFSVPPNFIRHIIPGVTLPSFFTASIFPSFCTYKDDDDKTQESTSTKYIVIAVSTVLFGFAAYRLIQATGAPDAAGGVGVAEAPAVPPAPGV